MERKHYKAINFDLDTNKLKKYYPRYQQAYSDLLRFFDLIGAFQKKFERSGTCVKKKTLQT